RAIPPCALMSGPWRCIHFTSRACVGHERYAVADERSATHMVATQGPETTFGIVSLQQLSDAFARNVTIIRRQTAGLTHADSLLQPVMRGNCLNWVLGHIVSTRGLVLRVLGAEPVLSAAHAERYARGSAPVLGEEAGILTLPALLDA